MIVLSSFSF